MGQNRTPKCPVCKKRSKQIDASSFIARKRLNPLFFKTFYTLGKCESCNISFSTTKINALFQSTFGNYLPSGIEKLDSGCETKLLEMPEVLPAVCDLRPAVLEENNTVLPSSTTESNTQQTVNKTVSKSEEEGLNVHLQYQDVKLDVHVAVPEKTTTKEEPTNSRLSRDVEIVKKSANRRRPNPSMLAKARADKKNPS